MLPKPKALLRLEYPNSQYHTITAKNCPYTFKMNDYGVIESKTDCSLNIVYPKMKATIYLTYKNVEGNVDKLLSDAQKLTYEHVVKADAITEQPYVNKDKNVYGMFYEVTGNAASQSQFYVTDSVQHFLTGSIYFQTKPNYDSILPAAEYLKNDIRSIMETVEWK